MLGDKQISSVGIFDVVAFYTLFRVHLTLIIVYICPKKVLYCSFSGFLCLEKNYAEIGTFGRVLGQTGSNGTQRRKDQARNQAKPNITLVPRRLYSMTADDSRKKELWMQRRSLELARGVLHLVLVIT